MSNPAQTAKECVEIQGKIEAFYLALETQHPEMMVLWALMDSALNRVPREGAHGEARKLLIGMNDWALTLFDSDLERPQTLAQGISRMELVSELMKGEKA